MKKCLCCGYANADWAKLCKSCKAKLPRESDKPETDNHNEVEKPRVSKRKRSE